MVSREEKFRRKLMKDAHLRAEQESRAALMPLDRPQLEALLDSVDAAVEADGCDHSLRATDAWVMAHDVDLTLLHGCVEEYGGCCDCEVVMNVHPEDVFEPVRSQRG